VHVDDPARCLPFELVQWVRRLRSNPAAVAATDPPTSDQAPDDAAANPTPRAVPNQTADQSADPTPDPATDHTTPDHAA